MFILGITGGIGSGKSTVSGILEERGLPVIDADEISRKVTAEGGRAVDAIREEFGEKAVDSSGAMNRKVVSDIVFNDRMKLDKLSGIVHKYVFEEISDELDILNQKGTKCVVLDVPIPVNKFIDMCNQIWVVTCETNVRIRRLKERGLEESDAIRRNRHADVRRGVPKLRRLHTR